MDRTQLFAIGLTLTLLLVVFDADAGRLGDASDAARGGSDDDSSSNSHASGASSWDEDEGTECGDLCLAFVRYTLLAPWTIPHDILGANSMRQTAYDDYPYRRRDGEFLRFYPRRPSDPARDTVDASSDQSVAGQVGLEGTTDFVLSGAGVSARLMLPVPVEFDTRWVLLTEPTAADGRAQVLFGAEHLTWRFAQSERIQFRTGAGPQHFIELTPPEAAQGSVERPPPRSFLGLDVFYGFEALIARPLLLSGQAHLGFVGEALTWQARLTLGAMWGPVELYAGYHHVDVGSVPLGGLVSGARFWW